MPSCVHVQGATLQHCGHSRSRTCLCCMVRPGQLKADHLQLLRLAATLVPFSPHMDNRTSLISPPGNLFLSTVHLAPVKPVKG
ncbi:hypothetical protein AMECASPLE_039147 [Ameca splendens]|uniref:Uncharacterized protein n=1 Tax=Ameca splendens TaxID=208324 RepID=A0ABV0Y931_9TELE